MSVHAAALHELALARMRICVKRFIYTCLVGIISSGLGIQIYVFLLLTRHIQLEMFTSSISVTILAQG